MLIVVACYIGGGELSNRRCSVSVALGFLFPFSFVPMRFLAITRLPNSPWVLSRGFPECAAPFPPTSR